MNNNNEDLELDVRYAYFIDKIYNKEYRPPLWTQNIINVKSNRFKDTLIYYDNEYDISDIKTLFYQREPVNIAMKQYYNKQLLKQMTNFENGYYYDYFNKHNSLPPNIGVYTRALFCRKPNAARCKDVKEIHIYNAIGLAFDNENQPDYKYFSSLSTDVEKDNKAIEIYVKIFNKMFKAFIDWNNKFNILNPILFITFLGANNFATLWHKISSSSFIYNIWFVALKKSFDMFKEKIKFNYSIKVLSTHTSNKYKIKLQKIFEDKIKFENHQDNKFRQVTIGEDLPDDYIKRGFFVNAWDCFSIPGNGNNGDNSLDGYFGRHTNIALLGSGIFNDYITDNNYIIVDSYSDVPIIIL